VSRQAQAGRHTAKAAGRIGGGRKPEDDPEGRPEGRAEAKGASPEWKSDLKGTGRTGSQEPVRNGRPGDWFQAQAGRQRKGTPRQDQRAGLIEAGGASRTWKRTSRRADSQESRARGFRPEEVGRYKRRRPQGRRREERNKPQGRCRGVGLKAKAGETIPKAGRRQATRAARFGPGVKGSSWMALPEGRLKIQGARRKPDT